MSTIHAITYDYSITPAKSDTVDDPSGPFAGLYVATSGNVVIWNRSGPQAANPLTIAVVAGSYLQWPIKRVGATGTTAIVFGVVGYAIVRPG
jgi:hypothetical protein